MRSTVRAQKGDAGFSLIELLVVVAIIATTLAVALPKIGRYIRSYQINAATREVVGDLQGARNRGVMKNVNFGSVFYITSPTTYRTALEDDQTVPKTPRRLTLAEVEDRNNFPGQLIATKNLPGDVRFGTTCASAGAFVANDKGIRFNRLGAACDPGTTTCGGDLVPPGAPPNLVWNDATGQSFVCLTQQSTGLRRLIRVSPGGRVRSAEGQG